jgi:hypothetical protein
MPKLPRALRPDDTYTYEDAGCTLLADYVIHSYGTRDDAPDVEVIALQADFGGRDWVAVPLNAISGRRLNDLEELIREEVEVNHRASAEDARCER